MTWLTPDAGKLSLIAKGVRKEKSKLAGGIELFSESDISFIRGKGEIGTLISSRLITHYQNIAREIERTQTGFNFLKIVNKTVEEESGQDWYELLKSALTGLNDPALEVDKIRLWFNLHWLKLSGHSPNLRTDTEDQQLKEQVRYFFDFEKMAFEPNSEGPFVSAHIKLLRLGLRVSIPQGLGRVQGAKEEISDAVELTDTMLKQFVRI